MIEVLVMLGFVAVLLLVTAPQFVVPPQLPVGLAASQVAADLGLARRLAITSHLDYTATFAPSPGGFTSYTVAAAGGQPGPDFPKSFPAGVVVTGTQTITFVPSGATTAPAQLTFAAGGATAQIQVTTATGFVQVSGP